jgi:hypothetical protein
MPAHQYSFMRTTVELPDALIRRAKLYALQKNTTLKSMITEALEKYLDGTLENASTSVALPESPTAIPKMTRPMVETGPDCPIASMDANAVINKEGKLWKI